MINRATQETKQAGATHPPGPLTAAGLHRVDSTALACIAAIAAAGAALVGIALAEHGPGVTPDSASYLAAARSLADGSGYLNFNGRPLAVFPPLYPALLALLLGTGIGPSASGAAINIASQFGLIATVGYWSRHATRSTGLAVAASLLVALSPPLFHVAVHLWSDILFIFLVVVCAYRLSRYLEDRTPARLLLAAVPLSLALLTRNAGILFIAPWTALLLLSARSPSRLRDLAGAALFAGAALLPAGLWMAFGPGSDWVRPASPLDVLDTAGLLLTTIGDWLTAGLLGPETGILIAGIALAALGSAVLHLWLKRDGAVMPATVAVAFAGAAGYGLLLCVVAALIVFDPIRDRLAAPIYPLAAVAVVALLYRLTGAPASAGAAAGPPVVQRLGRIAIGVAGLLWLAVPVTSLAGAMQQIRLRGLGFAELTWQHSELGAHLRSWNPDGVLYSNYPAAVYWLSGHRVRLAPRAELRDGRPNLRPPGLVQLSERLDAGETSYIVWFDRKPPDYMMSFEALARGLWLEPVARLADGGVWKATTRLTAREGWILRADDR